MFARLVGVFMHSDGRAEHITRPHHVGVSPNRSAGINLQERERVRIGFDLHDGPAQTMSAALLQVRMLQDAEGDELKSGLADLRSTLSVALEEIYGLIENLGGRGCAEDGLVPRLRSCVESFAARSGIEPTFEVTGDIGAGSDSLQIAVFRIVQEALSNVARHSGATSVDIRLALSDDGVIVEIADNGKGFVVDGVAGKPRGREPYGLHSMQERARLLEGECTIESAPRRGTRIRVEIPAWQA